MSDYPQSHKMKLSQKPSGSLLVEYLGGEIKFADNHRTFEIMDVVDAWNSTYCRPLKLIDCIEELPADQLNKKDLVLWLLGICADEGTKRGLDTSFVAGLIREKRKP